MYFFKVRKEALKAYRAIQAGGLFEKDSYLMKTYDQRNFNDLIKFYKPNKFDKVLEYYIDKYILKFLSKFKGHKLTLKAEHQEEEKKEGGQREVAPTS